MPNGYFAGVDGAKFWANGEDAMLLKNKELMKNPRIPRTTGESAACPRAFCAPESVLFLCLARWLDHSLQVRRA
jgi:hypothetical protein